MPPQKRSSDRADRISGGVSVLAFFLLLGVLGTHNTMPLLSASLAVVVYFGVRMLVSTPSPNPHEAPIQPAKTPKETLTAMRRAGTTLLFPPLQKQVEAVCVEADGLLYYCETHPNRAQESELIIRHYLELALQSVQLYQTSTGRFAVAPEHATHSLEELLSNVQNTFRTLYKRLSTEDDTALARELKTMNRTLEELNTIYLQQGGEES